MHANGTINRLTAFVNRKCVFATMDVCAYTFGCICGNRVCCDDDENNDIVHRRSKNRLPRCVVAIVMMTMMMKWGSK